MALIPIPRPKDELENLLEVKFRDIPFPCKDLTASFSQDLAQHKYINKDGAKIEATGRNPMSITGTAIFINGLSPSRSETWKSEELFTASCASFLEAMKERSTGEFQEPMIGTIKCKPNSFAIHYSPDVRNGVQVNFNLIETSEDGDALDGLSERLSAMGKVKSRSAMLDKKIADLGLIASLPDYPSFDDLTRSIQSVFDKPTMLANKYKGKIDSAIYKCNSVLSAIDRANDTKNSLLGIEVTKHKADLKELNKQLMVSQNPTAYYFVKQTTTIANIAQLTKNTIDEITILNTDLAKNPTIQQMQLVRYYKR